MINVNVIHHNTRGLLSLGQTRMLTGMAPRTIKRLERQGRFPASIEVAPRVHVWDCMEVFDWIETKKSDRDWCEKLIEPARGQHELG